MSRLAALTQEALIWSLAHITCGALGEPIAKPVYLGFAILFNCPLHHSHLFYKHREASINPTLVVFSVVEIVEGKSLLSACCISVDRR